MVRVLRARHYFWIFFGVLFIWSALFYRKQKHARQALKKNDLKKDEPDLMIGHVRVGKDWVNIPSNVNLPPGLDIEVDMQTGQRRVKLHQDESKNLPVVDNNMNDKGLVEDAEYSPMPQRKWQRIYEAKHKTAIDQMLEGLADSEDKVVQKSINYLEEHCGTIDVGAGLVRSYAFRNLLGVMEHPKTEYRIKAAEVLFACVQNNPVAIDGILETETVDFLVQRLYSESDLTVLRRILSSLVSIVRGDKGVKSLLLCARSSAVMGLSHLSLRLMSERPIMDRVLVLLITLVSAHNGQYAEYSAAINLMENIIKNMKKPYSDWMTHEFRPFCKNIPKAIESKPAMTVFCKELNANPTDTSMLQ